jgi:hypothetical protein
MGAGAIVRTVPASHAVMMSHSKEVLGLITLGAKEGGVQDIRETA